MGTRDNVLVVRGMAAFEAAIFHQIVRIGADRPHKLAPMMIASVSTAIIKRIVAKRRLMISSPGLVSP
jgi:hypothetical protein